ncbi:MAG: site-specific integrase [Chloracidobacterium sp.]|nr:site-specific integrase [Chloracidobacterium sp.]
MIKKLQEKNLGEFLEPAAMSLNAFLEKWLEDVVRIKVRSATYDGYESKINTHIRESIGKKRLCDLEGFDIQKLYNDMTKRGLSSKTVRHVHNVLNPALKQAVRWRLIRQNPCDLCELPKLVKKEMRYFTPEETSIFLTHAKGDRYYAAFVLAIECGMRPEEFLGLRWKDIDFEHSRVYVRRALVAKKGGGFEFCEPKTAKSRRSIPLSISAVATLKIHRRSQLEAKMKVIDIFADSDLVFPTEIGTPMRYGNLDRRHFKQIIRRANEAIKKDNLENNTNNHGIPVIRLYDLRHTMATLLLLKGVNPKVVSERLGHSTISLTLDTYSHVLPTMQEAATDHMEKLMFGT